MGRCCVQRSMGCALAVTKRPHLWAASISFLSADVAEVGMGLSPVRCGYR